MEQVVDTMLHELSHNVFGPHDEKFHALWNQLREEYEGLIRKGYTGEGFLSEGKKLGGQRVPRHEARRIARIAAERRRTLSAGSGQKLGGAPVRAGTDIRDVIVNAIERRATITKGCGSGGEDDKESRAIADQAMRNGFRTKAEEDEANDQAIAQALWELVQEDEKEKYGPDYIAPSATNPTGNGGGGTASNRSIPQTASRGKRPFSIDVPAAAKKALSTTKPNPTRPLSRLVQEQPPSAKSSSSTLSASSSVPAPAREKLWECPVCTCHNPMTYLCCDACTTERPEEGFAIVIERPVLKPAPAASNFKTLSVEKPKTWTCHKCTTVMDNQWWTCSTCATVKLTS